MANWPIWHAFAPTGRSPTRSARLISIEAPVALFGERNQGGAMRPPISTRKLTRWTIAALVLLVLGLVLVKLRPPVYSLELPATTYSGLAGLHLEYLPGLGGRGACPENGDVGCIVGFTSLGDTRPSKKEQVSLEITCSQNGRLIYTTRADPREFIVPGLAPGAYTLSFSG